MSDNFPSSVPLQVAERLADLPSLPQAAVRLMSELASEEPELSEVTRIIESEPALVSRVLRLANSPYYGVRQEISTVERAVTLLGTLAIEAMTISITVLDALKTSGEQALDFVAHWQHSLAAAAAARQIAADTKLIGAEEAYVAAILHDVGRPVLDICAGDLSAKVFEALEKPGGVGVEIERSVLGIDHAGIGEFTLRRWNLPRRISRAVGLHHTDDLGSVDADERTRNLALVIQAADYASWSSGFASTQLGSKLTTSPRVEKLLARIDAHSLLDAMCVELETTADLFGVSVPDVEHLRRALAANASELARFRAMQHDIEERLSSSRREMNALELLRRSQRDGASRAQLLETVLEAVCEAVGVERALYLDVDRRGNKLTVIAARDITAAKAEVAGETYDLPGEGSQLASALAEEKATFVDEDSPILAAMESSTVAAAPVLQGGRVAGLLVAANPISSRPIEPEQLEMLSRLGVQAGVVIENALLKEYSQQLKAEAQTDPLTSLNNRRSLMRLLQREIYRAQRYQTPLSMVMIDIDRFKSFNDNFGHQAGDHLLESFGKLMVKSCRNIDIPGRFGGEEFLIILPETSPDAALKYAERLRRLTEKMGERLAERFKDVSFTISVGITSFNEKDDDMDSFINRVDNAMYSAKKRGRNRVCVL